MLKVIDFLMHITSVIDNKLLGVYDFLEVLHRGALVLKYIEHKKRIKSLNQSIAILENKKAYHEHKCSCIWKKLDK